MTEIQARRHFLRYLAGSPLLAATAFGPTRVLLRAAAESGEALELGEVVSSVDEALSVFDFHAVAREKLPPAHYGYLATGTDDDYTLRANREGFRRYQVRARRLVDVTQVDSSIELLGTTWPSPIVLAPAGNQKAFAPEGEAAVARAAAKTSSLQVLSMMTTTAVEEVVQQRGEPVWFQIYPGRDWGLNQSILKRVERAGSPVVVWTVDQVGGRNTETAKRLARTDERDCSLCHDRSSFEANVRRKPMLSSIDRTAASGNGPALTWDSVRRMRDLTTMKLFVKGIVTAEDAALCLEHGADGLVVSNHGGRAESSGRSTIECLEEIVSAVGGRIPVVIDSGFRRGTDIFKAIALGADAIAIGRPYVWGLASFGEEGVEAVVKLLRAELNLVMRQAGAPSVGQISRSHVRRAA